MNLVGSSRRRVCTSFWLVWNLNLNLFQVQRVIDVLLRKETEHHKTELNQNTPEYRYCAALGHVCALCLYISQYKMKGI